MYFIWLGRIARRKRLVFSLAPKCGVRRRMGSAGPLIASHCQPISLQVEANVRDHRWIGYVITALPTLHLIDWIYLFTRISVRLVCTEVWANRTQQTWRQTITFKLLPADWSPPRNRRSGAYPPRNFLSAPHFLDSPAFLRCKFKFLRGVSEFSWTD